MGDFPLPAFGEILAGISNTSNPPGLQRILRIADPWLSQTSCWKILWERISLKNTTKKGKNYAGYFLLFFFS